MKTPKSNLEKIVLNNSLFKCPNGFSINLIFFTNILSVQNNYNDNSILHYTAELEIGLHVTFKRITLWHDTILSIAQCTMHLCIWKVKSDWVGQ